MTNVHSAAADAAAAGARRRNRPVFTDGNGNDDGDANDDDGDNDNDAAAVLETSSTPQFPGPSGGPVGLHRAVLLLCWLGGFAFREASLLPGRPAASVLAARDHLRGLLGRTTMLALGLAAPRCDGTVWVTQASVDAISFHTPRQPGRVADARARLRHTTPIAAITVRKLAAAAASAAAACARTSFAATAVVCACARVSCPRTLAKTSVITRCSLLQRGCCNRPLAGSNVCNNRQTPHPRRVRALCCGRCGRALGGRTAAAGGKTPNFLGQLLAVDVLALASMKNAAKCDN